MLTDDQKKLINALAKWLQVCQQEGYKITPESFLTDVDHSALLQRILEGKDPLDEPPPLSFSYPWYELAEGKICVATEVYQSAVNFEHLVINQFLWVVKERLVGGEIVIIPSNSKKGTRYHLRQRKAGELSEQGTEIESHQALAGFNQYVIWREKA